MISTQKLFDFFVFQRKSYFYHFKYNLLIYMHNLFQSDFILIIFTNQLFNFLRYPFDFKQVIKYNIFFPVSIKNVGAQSFNADIF